jgi:hypothetical protein
MPSHAKYRHKRYDFWVGIQDILCPHTLSVFFFNSFITVLALAHNARAAARILAPSTACLLTAFFTSGLQPLQ